MIAAATIATGANRPEFATPQGLGLAFSKLLWALLNSLGNAFSSAWNGITSAASSVWSGITNTYERVANGLSGSGWNTDAQVSEIAKAQMEAARARGLLNDWDNSDAERNAAYQQMAEQKAMRDAKPVEVGQFDALIDPTLKSIASRAANTQSSGDKAKEIFLLSTRGDAQKYVDSIKDPTEKAAAQASLEAAKKEWDANAKTAAGQAKNNMAAGQAFYQQRLRDANFINVNNYPHGPTYVSADGEIIPFPTSNYNLKNMYGDSEGRKIPHRGTDLSGLETGTPVPVTRDGIVIYAEFHGDKKDGYGNTVAVLHENGRISVYTHLKEGSISVKVNDFINKGTIVGGIGNTGGWSEGPHLHYQVMDVYPGKLQTPKEIADHLSSYNTLNPIKKW